MRLKHFEEIKRVDGEPLYEITLFFDTRDEMRQAYEIANAGSPGHRVQFQCDNSIKFMKVNKATLNELIDGTHEK